MTDEELKQTIASWLNDSDEAGEKAGGSGHLSTVSFTVDKIIKKEKTSAGWKVEYAYTQTVETEFTYYPDNPPYEYPGEGKVEIDKNGNIVAGD